MKCLIKSIKTGVYFEKHLFNKQNHWLNKIDAKIFDSVKDARETIKKYKLKNVEVEKI